MVLIQFETKQQAERVVEIISEQIISKNLLSYIRYEQNDAVFLTLEDEHQLSIIRTIRESFLTFIKKDLISHWLLKIVTEKFFYSEKEECSQIVEIASSIMHEDNPKNVAFWNELKYKIHHGLVSIFERNVSFSFTSFLMFRMRGVMESLITYVELAIDEYKMEQEYQSFIHTLRTHMLSVSTKMEHLHIRHQYYFDFYDNRYKKMEREDIAQYVDRKMFADYPMYIDSHVLAPLISIAPKHLYIYSDEEDHPLILTIQKIFEERVNVIPIQFFKEDHQLKSR